MEGLREVMARREELTRRSEALRAQLADQAGPLRDALGRVEGAIAALRRTVFSPFALAAAAGLIVALRSRRTFALATGVWSAWRFLSPFLRVIPKR